MTAPPGKANVRVQIMTHETPVDETTTTQGSPNGVINDEPIRKKPKKRFNPENKCVQCCQKGCKKHGFMIATGISVILGFTIGLLAQYYQAGPNVVTLLKLPGELFINLLKLTILPLIASNIIVVTSTLDPSMNGKIGLFAFFYILLSNTFCAMVGLSSALILKPGSRVLNQTIANQTATDPSLNITLIGLSTVDIFYDLFHNLLPENLLGVAIFSRKSKYVNGQRETEYIFSSNMIGVLFCSLVFGMAAKSVGRRSQAFLEFFEALLDIVLKIMHWFMVLTPIGVCFMIAGAFAQFTLADIGATFRSLGWFILTVVVGLLVHFIFMVVSLAVVGRVNPMRMLKHSFQVWLISMITTSPVVAIPDMYDGCDAYGIPESVSRFIIPLSVATKGDAAGVFITSACVFLAQYAGQVLSTGDLVVIWLLTSTSLLAIPNVPSASILIIVSILASVGVPSNQMALLFSMEWLLDRLRSGSMGLSHMFCVAVTYHNCKKALMADQVQRILLEDKIHAAHAGGPMGDLIDDNLSDASSLMDKCHPNQHC